MFPCIIVKFQNLKINKIYLQSLLTVNTPKAKKSVSITKSIIKTNRTILKKKLLLSYKNVYECDLIVEDV